jgi:hypoxanthine phosphoribosyltransferase
MNNTSNVARMDLSGHIMELKNESLNIIDLNEHMLKIIQLYVDGLIGPFMAKNPHDFSQDEKRATFNSLWEAVQDITSLRYTVNNENESHKTEMKKFITLENVLEREEIILNCGSRGLSNTRHIYKNYDSVKKSIQEAKNIFKTGKIDFAIAIASGSFEPASVISKFFGIKEILPVRYSHYRKNDDKVLLPFEISEDYLLEKIGDANILLFEDQIITGETINTIEKWVAGYNPKKINMHFTFPPSNCYMRQRGYSSSRHPLSPYRLFNKTNGDHVFYKEF